MNILYLYASKEFSIIQLKKANFTTEGMFFISEQSDSDITWDGAGVLTFDLSRWFLAFDRDVRDVLRENF